MRFIRLTALLSFVCLALVDLTSASAATLRVCATGCQYTNLQPAIDAAAPGDTILLRAGETFVGPFVLRAKPAATLWITIRSDAADSLLPADGVRLVPSGKTGANTNRSLLPRLVGQGGALITTPVVRTASGAHHYILRFLEIDGSANMGFETLIVLGEDTTAAPAHNILVDRVYVHGHAYKGMKRGITLNGQSTDVLNSYISDIKAVNADSQGIAGYNGAGPFRIINNYIEGAGENILFGGSDPAIANLVPTNIEVRRNHLFKPLSWQKDILAPPASPKASLGTAAGSLAAGTHYLKVVAVMTTDTVTAMSVGSTEVSVAVSSAGKTATVSWAAVPGADRYRIYRSTASGAQAVYLETSSAVTSFTYTGAAEKAGKPLTAGTKWTVKNLFELKNAQQVVVDGNVMENNWAAGQYGYAILVTPRNQGGKAPWVRVRDVVFSNNIVRHAAGVMQLSGYDSTVGKPSQQTQRITLRNNLFYDISNSKYGGGAKVFLLGEGPDTIVFDRNTIVHTNSSVVYAYSSQPVGNFTYTNNISQHLDYGIMGESGRPGQYTIDRFFPGSTIRNNVLAGGPAASYPTPNAFPSVAQWNASFVNMAASDYRLLTSSVFYSAGAGGTVPGADLGALDAALAGDTAGPTPNPPPAPEPTPVTPPAPPSGNAAPIARPGGPYSGTAGASITVNGSSSSDPDGSVTSYEWVWGDEIVVNAADVPAADIVGDRWVRAQTAGAAASWALHNPDRGAAKAGAALAAPASYVDVRVYAAAGVPYRLWLRMRAQSDHYSNDSMFVQFSGAVNAQGAAVDRIGTTAASIVVLEEGSGAGVSGWGWNDAGYGTLAAPVYFATSGMQTLRIQQREDGIMWDQIVLSAATYATMRPGVTRADQTIVESSAGTGGVAAHVYSVPGQFPIVLVVTDDKGTRAAAMTTATIR